jgi:hypothetical protein
MNTGSRGVRKIHFPFALPFPRGVHLPFSLLFPFIVALAAGAGLRLVAMIGYPGALWFAGDSYVYLGAALRPQPNLSKTTGYSVFLHALEPFHSLTLVAGLQHLMGLAVAVMIYLLLRRNGVSQRWATAATLPVLLDGFVIEDEHMVMAEALFTFLVFVSMLLILWQTRVRWPVALLAGLLAGCAVDVRSEGLPVLLMFPVVLLVHGLRRDGTWRWRNWCWLACWPGAPSTCAAKACRCCSCSRSCCWSAACAGTAPGGGGTGAGWTGAPGWPPPRWPSAARPRSRPTRGGSTPGGAPPRSAGPRGSTCGAGCPPSPNAP